MKQQPPNGPRRERISKHLRATVFRVKGRVCHLCRNPEPPADTCDHLKPVAAGGSTILSNLAPAHKSCNQQRGRKAVSDFQGGYVR
jgi:Restriction endonuclease